jgi:hypothetical protein
MDIEALIAVQAESYQRAEGGLRSSWPRSSAMDARSWDLLGRAYVLRACDGDVAGTPSRPARRVYGGGRFVLVCDSRWGEAWNLKRTPWGSVVVAEGDGSEHRAVATDGLVRIVDRPGEDLLAAWVARHGSAPEWAAAWFEIRPERLVSYSASRSG